MIVLAAVLAAALALAPAWGAAQTSAPAAAPQAAVQTASPARQEQTSDQDETTAFLHSSSVRSIARLLHLSLNTTVGLFLILNFAVIFLAIAVPVNRFMPRIIRKRSQTLKHDLVTARAATEDAKARLAAVEARLAGLDEEIRHLRQQVEQESLEDEKRIKASIEEESALIVASAEQEIGAAVAHARRGLRQFAAGLAIEQAEKQLVLTPETDRALIAEFIAAVSHPDAGKGGAN